MKVTITYFDDTSLTIEEVIKRAKDIYGSSAEVEIQPSTHNPLDIIYFGIQQLITHDQLSLLFDNDTNLYTEKLVELRQRTLTAVKQELSSVIKDNEIKVS